MDLYELPGRFFAELTYDTAVTELLELRSFSGPEGLADYAVHMQLPNWMAGAS